MAEQFLTLMADYSEADQQRISAWHGAIQQAGFTGRHTTGLPHHISLATFPLEKEAEAVALTRRAAEAFGPVTVHLSHLGVFSGGEVLFAAPDKTPELTALHQFFGGDLLNGHPWVPHTTLLIDEPQVIFAALPVAAGAFSPLLARIDRLHLCAFWPTREILRVEMTGHA